MSKTFCEEFLSPLGAIQVTATKDGVSQVQLNPTTRLKDPNPNEHTRLCLQELSQYFKGSLKAFQVKTDVESTPFRQAVWNELKRIPYGETRSYEELAITLGNPRAIRAVAQANAKNPTPIIVPCHRVIGKNKQLSGYIGGLAMKQGLLLIEGAPFQNQLNL